VATPDIAEVPMALLNGSFEEKLAMARRLGYAGVELMVRDASELNPSGIKAALRRHELEVPQIATGELFGTDGLALVHPDGAVCRAAEQRLHDIVQLASLLGNRTMINIGRVRGRLDWFPPNARATARTRIVDAVQALCDYAAPYGVRITLEPCNRYELDFVNTTREGLEVASQVAKPNFGLMLDLFHMNIEDASIEGALREARQILWHLHIADSNRLPPGLGHLDFASIIATLREIDYEGYLSVEARALPDPHTAAGLAAEYMRQWL